MTNFISQIKKQFENVSQLTINIDGDEYLMLSDDEANMRARREIRDSLWAFLSSFIRSHSSVDIPEKYIEKMQSEMCEQCNEIIYGLIKDNFDEFVEDAIDADGRGHFIATYDGKEIELKTDDETIYLYRI